MLAQELYPGKFHPTVSHAFIALLAQKGLLQMLFTQNIDCLERRAGVPAEKIIEAHGSFATQRCIECKTEFPDADMKDHVFAGMVPQCNEDGCDGTVKPDIVFFGEALPSAFGDNSHQAAMADLVLILGTSLSVYPFAGLPEMTRQGKPRMLFNMERVGQLGRRPDDVIELGSCDAGIRKLAEELGWLEELEEYWRSVVGHEEAERQLRTAKEMGDEVEDEVQKLTEGVESALRFDSDSEDDAGGPSQHEPSRHVDGPRTTEKDESSSVAETSADAVEPKMESAATNSDSKGESTDTPAVVEGASKDAVEPKVPEKKTTVEDEKEPETPSL